MNANLVLNSTRLNPVDNERVEIFLVTFDRENKNRFREANRQKKVEICINLDLEETEKVKNYDKQREVK